MAELYDSTIYTEPDGTRWYRLYHLNSPSTNGIFSPSDTFETGVYKDENRWFQLNLAKEWDSKEYLIKQKNESDSEEVKGRFTQSVNCMDATYDDVRPNGTVVWNTTSGYVTPSSNYTGGLWPLKVGTYICKANNNSYEWWGGIGVSELLNGAVPGCQFDNSSPAVKTGYIDVYVPAATLLVSGFPSDTIGTESDTYTLTVSSETAWTATVPQDSFATLDVMSGSAGDTTVTMAVAANRGPAREVAVTFANTEDEIPFTVSQKSWLKYHRPVDQIESGGNCWWKSNIQLSTVGKITMADVVMNLDGTSSWHHTFIGTTGVNFRFSSKDTNNWFVWMYNQTEVASGNGNGGNKLTADLITITKTGIDIDGTESTWNERGFLNGTGTLWIWNSNNDTPNDNSTAGTKCGVITVYDTSDNVIARFEPARDDNDVATYYDSVNDVYLTNSGAGTAIPLTDYDFESDTDSLRMVGVGETKTITVTADNDWTVYSKPAWITVSPSTAEGSVNPVTVSVTAEMNDGNDFRFGTITFVDENGYAFDIAVRQGTHGELINVGKWAHGSTVVRKAYHGSNQIRQSMYGADMLFKRLAFPPTLNVSPKSLTFTYDGQPQTFTVTSDTSFKASCDSAWITLSTSGDTVTVTPSENASVDGRDTTITVTADNGDLSVSKTVSIHQNGYWRNVDYIHQSPLSGSGKRDDNIDTGIHMTVNTKFRVKAMAKGYFNGNILVGYYGNDSTDCRLIIHNQGGGTIAFDLNDGRIGNATGYAPTDGRLWDFEMGNYYITDHKAGQTWTGTTVSSISRPDDTIKIDMTTWWFQSLQIWEGNTLVFDGHAALDAQGNACIHDSVSGNFLTNNNLTLAAEEL